MEGVLEPEPDPAHDPAHDREHDLVLLLEACAARLGVDVLTRVRAEVGDDVRFQDGYVFQHLTERPLSISDLARRLGVTQQAASKQVADLAGRGLLSRRRDPDDGRSWLISLSGRGRQAVESGRRARAAIDEELVTHLGAAHHDALINNLIALSDQIGAMEYLMNRRLRPEESR